MKKTMLFLAALSFTLGTTAFAQAPRLVSSHAPVTFTHDVVSIAATLQEFFRIQPDEVIADRIYVGSEICLMCHTTYGAWHDT